MLSSLIEWIKKPYSDDMDVMHWILFLGLTSVAVVLWSRVLKMITE